MPTDNSKIVTQFMGRCINFNGLINDKCDAGIAYHDFEVGDKAIFHTMPCRIENGCSDKCNKATFMTQEEAEAKLARARANASEHLNLMVSGTCPHCKRPMTQQQVGPCVYASPCGHRLFQGKIKKAG
jgi:hypothetical protein